MHLRALVLMIATGIVLVAGSAVAGTPEQDKITACNAEALQQGLKGYNRLHFLKDCQSGAHVATVSEREQTISACDRAAAKKDLKGPERKAFMRTCLSKKK